VQDRENLQIVLVHPTDDKNIGFVARAIKTMGVRSLVIVSKRKINLKQAAITAVHAKDIINACRLEVSLANALKDSVLIAGITRRTGRHRKYFSLTPEQLAERIRSIKKGEISLVFGNEKHGLSDQELTHCHLAVSIPSSPLFPSLNLSHAVQIITYVLYRQLSQTEQAYFSPIPQKRITAMARSISGIIKKLGLFREAPRKDIDVFFQDLLARAELSPEEAQRLESISSQVAGIIYLKNKSRY
jgi:TrmH family RNA methyltransferase